MFSLFKKKSNSPKYTDKIWLTSQAKELNCLAQLKRNLAGTPVLVVSSFEQTLNHIEKQLTTIKLGYKRASNLNDLRDIQGFVLVHSSLILQAADLQSNTTLSVFFLEHFPLLDRDTLLLDLTANIFSKHTEITYLLSLDDPLFVSIGSEKIRQILRQMGMDENEAIEHSLISSSIVKAQARISKLVHIEKQSDSEAKWYELNVGTSLRES